MGVKISSLTNKSPLSGTEELEINDDGTTKKTTAQDIADLGGGGGGGGVESVTGDGVNNADSSNPVISFPTLSETIDQGGQIDVNRVVDVTGTATLTINANTSSIQFQGDGGIQLTVGSDADGDMYRRASGSNILERRTPLQVLGDIGGESATNKATDFTTINNTLYPTVQAVQNQIIASVADYLPISGGTLTGALTLNSDPTTALHAATKQYVDALVVGLWDDRGTFDASVNAYPSSGGSGSAGAILKGDIWTVSNGGTLPTGQVVETGDTVRALVNSPGNTQANWAIAQNNIGYTPLSNTLNSGQIFVGNGSNVAAAVSMSGDISITNTGVTAYAGTVPVSKGGTNITSYAVGDILYASDATALSKLAAVAAGSVLGSAGATTAPAYIAVSNGLTATATTFKLGGALTADTNLSGAFSIGIGATPSAKLHVVGLGTTTGELVRFASNTPTTRFSILDNGQTTWVGAVSGNNAIGRSDTITVTATANSDTQTGWDYNFNNVDGGFTPLTRTIAQWRLNGAATPIFSIQPAQINSGGVNLLSLTFAGDMTVRNQSGALFLRGGSGSTTGVKFSAVFASSTNNNVSFNFTGTNHNISAGSGLTRAFTCILIDNAVVSASANTITYTGIDYNPDLSSLGGSTLTHYAMRIRSGLTAIGHGNAPTAAVDVAASITAAASLRIRSGTAPTSPNDGDIWYDGTDIKIRVGGTTKTFTIV